MINVARLRTAIAALRSGNYPQGRKMLRAPEGYCCLGVLTDVAIKADREVALSVGDYIDTATVWYERPELPPVVRDWYGLEDTNPILLFDDVNDRTAIDCNDELEMSFDPIADLFEQLVERQQQREMDTRMDHAQ
jgi:hypothetical protein